MLKKRSSITLVTPESWLFFNPFFSDFNLTEFTVNCAGTQCELSQLSSLWHLSDKEECDAEVLQSSHRFHYLVERLATGIGEGDRFKMLKVIESWLDDFDDKTFGAVWQPYTVSERLCNWVTCWQVLQPQDDRPEFAHRWLYSIHRHALFLASKLEYPASNIVNNHILNNGRALYIVGSFLNQEEITELGRKLLRIHLPLMIGNGGFLLEASSHYQLLLTRSVLEVDKIAHVTADRPFIQWLGDLPDKMLSASQALLPDDLHDLDDMPRIGDVSPDVPFVWFSPYSNKLKANWNTLWNRPTSIYGDIVKCHQDGWIVQKNGQWCMVAFSHPDLNLYPVGHGHNDFGSYCLYYDGHPIVVDIGRLDYQSGSTDEKKGIDADLHNTVMLDDQSLLPVGHGWASIISGSARRKADCYVDNNNHTIHWTMLRQSNVVWNRQLSLKSANTVSLIDQFNDINIVQGYLHFAPSAILKKEHDNHMSLKIGGCTLNIFIEGASELWLEQGSFFPRYGEQCEATRLCWKGDLGRQLSEVEVRFVEVHPNIEGGS